MVSNEQALLVYALGDIEGYNLLQERFLYFIRKTASIALAECAGLGYDFKDFENTGLIGLKQAIETYGVGEIPFAPYANVVISREINGDIRKAKTPTNLRFYSSLTLDAKLKEEQESLSLCDIVGEDDIYTSKSFRSEMVGNIEDFVSIPLEDKQIKVVQEKILGYSFAEISLRNNISRRSMDSIVESIRAKLDDSF